MVYLLSVVASEDESAALTIGLKVYGHMMSLFSASWPSDEVFRFPSLDARRLLLRIALRSVPVYSLTCDLKGSAWVPSDLGRVLA